MAPAKGVARSLKEGRTMKEPELKPCPFCQQQAVFIGVHDDEGNYHGRIGCDYENDA